MNRFEGYSEDYGRPGHTHLLFEHKPDNQPLANALIGYQVNPKLRETTGNEAQAHAQQHFSFEHSIEKYIDLLEC
jgi:glycosyltransferase involved in cell wall biosynthesis